LPEAAATAPGTSDANPKAFARQQTKKLSLQFGGDPWTMRVVKTSIPHCRFLSNSVDTKALLSAIAELSAL